MDERSNSVKDVRRRHPIFFWGTALVLLLLLSATAVVAARIPLYRSQASAFNQEMNEAERETRDRILNSEARRSELAIALLQRELRLNALSEKSVHLALNVADSTLSLRHGAATLREVRVTIGPDSTVQAADGHTWRFVRALGERHLEAKVTAPSLTVPEWLYVSRGEPVPPEAER